MTSQPLPLPIILFLVFAVVVPLLILTLGLTQWEHLPGWARAALVVLAVLIVAVAFVAPGLLAH